MTQKSNRMLFGTLIRNTDTTWSEPLLEHLISPNVLELPQKPQVPKLELPEAKTDALGRSKIPGITLKTLNTETPELHYLKKSWIILWNPFRSAGTVCGT